jgi:hypothetical protein
MPVCFQLLQHSSVHISSNAFCSQHMRNSLQDLLNIHRVKSTLSESMRHVLLGLQLAEHGLQQGRELRLGMLASLGFSF